MKVRELIEELQKLDPELNVAVLRGDSGGDAMTSDVALWETEMEVPASLRKYPRFDDPIPNGQKVIFIYG
jgi:hypothetical protein